MKNVSCFLILDFGSQYTWLIARELRELGFYAKVEPYHFPLEKIKKLSPAGIILSGGPASVLESNSPSYPVKELAKEAPLLGICYGLQLICRQWEGHLVQGDKRSYGKSHIHWLDTKVTHAMSAATCRRVWMSHGDFVSQLPKGFMALAWTEKKVPAVIFKDKDSVFQTILALQFHPEVSHTENGKNILLYFTEKICGVQAGLWTEDSMLNLAIKSIQNQVKKDDIVLCALSGGVDSTVAASILTNMFGADRVFCIFIDTGFLRENEFQNVLDAYKNLNLNVKGIVAKKTFMQALSKITEPEEKRKIIGKVFIDIFTQAAKDILPFFPRKNANNDKPSLKNICFMQGTLYPDVIESLSVKGPSAVIKSHHNVGGLPKNLAFRLIEPLRFLFKDEVRKIGKKLDLPTELLQRHPFPGPGLAIRIEGEITLARLAKLRQADSIYMEELKKINLYDQIWQAFAVLLAIKSVGVQGDSRTYEEVIVLRAVVSRDGMTADWFAFPANVLHRISDRITNEVKGVGRVLYDITSKPPGTIEWM